MKTEDEQLIDSASGGFADAQAALRGVRESLFGTIEVGWHDTVVDSHEGCFALVRTGADNDGLVGEVLEVRYAGKSVFVYCVGSADVPTDISLSRRAFIALEPLWADSLKAAIWTTK